MSDAVRIDVPGTVWHDALDPLASGMQADLGLPEPRLMRRGRGFTMRYDDVPAAVALELAEYVGGRGAMLLDQGPTWGANDPSEKAERDAYRAAVKLADRIRETVAG